MRHLRIPVDLLVGQASGPAHDGRGAVAQAVHLVQAAGLVAGWHQEEVGAGFDPVRERVVEAAVEPGAASCSTSRR